MSTRTSRREFVASSAGLAALSAAQSGSANRPNVLLICDDQHCARNLGCYGDPLVRTPHLDRLASRGTRFTHAYSNNMICAPSRVSMVTGQYCHSHGYFGNSGDFPDKPVWITSHLRQHGYQTAMIGKAHYGFAKVTKEFDYYRLCDRIDLPPDNPLKNDYFRMLVEKGREEDGDDVLSPKLGQNVPHRSNLPKELSVEAWTADCAIEFLRKRDRTRPFFAFASFQRPHAPITPPAPCDTMYSPSEIQLPPSANDTFEGKPAEQLAMARRPSAYPYHPADQNKLREIIAMYFGLISLVDDSIGRILAELDAQDLASNTLIIFTADHGDFSGEHGFFHKGLAMYEAIHRIPFIVAGPGLEAGRVSDEFVQQTDIFPSACEFAGLPIPESVQGMSTLPLCRAGNARWSRTAAFGEAEDRSCIRTRKYRMVYDPGGKNNELYDHDQDPWELHNVYYDSAYKPVRLELAEEFLNFYARTEKQAVVSTLANGGGNGYMPPGPVNDLWYKRMPWKVVKEKYHL